MGANGPLDYDYTTNTLTLGADAGTTTGGNGKGGGGDETMAQVTTGVNQTSNFITAWSTNANQITNTSISEALQSEVIFNAITSTTPWTAIPYLTINEIPGTAGDMTWGGANDVNLLVSQSTNPGNGHAFNITSGEALTAGNGGNIVLTTGKGLGSGSYGNFFTILNANQSNADTFAVYPFGVANLSNGASTITWPMYQLDGYQAICEQPSLYNTLVGEAAGNPYYNALEGAGNPQLTGEGNTAVGFGAFCGNKNLTPNSGSYNTAIGFEALSGTAGTISGVSNTAVGQSALYDVSTGTLNSGFGDFALYEGNGSYNTGMGSEHFILIQVIPILQLGMTLMPIKLEYLMLPQSEMVRK